MTPKPKFSLVETAYLRLMEQIRTNQLPSGYQATEPEFAEELDMSRTPVREALIRLQAEGLVELKPRRGARVLPVSVKDMNEIYELLIALEPEAAARLAEKGLDARQTAELEVVMSKMESAIEAKNLEGWADADLEFHEKLLAMHGNKRLVSFVKSLLNQSHRARMVTLKMREFPVRSTMEHREILDSIKRGEPDETRRVFRQHRERAANELLNLLDEYGLEQL